MAAVVFGMDTRGHEPQDYRAALRQAADPTLSQTGRADLDRTIDARIPDPVRWARMRQNDQYASWQTTGVWQPGAWDQVVTAGYAEPGWVMRNVTGTETLHYRDGDNIRSSTRERTLTVWMRCPAPGTDIDHCRIALISPTVVP